MMINIDTNLDEQLDKVKELLLYLKEIEKTADILKFISIQEFSKITGWSVPTVQNLYNRPDFPSTDYGKEKAETLISKGFAKKNDKIYVLSKIVEWSSTSRTNSK